ncbi:peptide-methionine (S)-S-oxide reductase MsrA [Cytophaga aurantiaca]|uniref:peptide-methionine (S)-S-oxide reductase MsrA n=1 Tax=Cytophaga aurantiaca TaxID=29530 RepID=UPI0005273690
MNHYIRKIGTIMLGLVTFMACSNTSYENTDRINPPMETHTDNTAQLDTATFGNGCFWCTEAIFQDIKGVVKVTSGYSGGTVVNPTYKQICTGTTGHAEALQIIFNPAIVSYSELLQMFWYSHDPTTLNQQGNDVGTQYRSVIFYHNSEQKKEAEFYKKKLEEEKVFDKPIVTEITAFQKFYPAEDYHQNYYKENGAQPYCMYIIRPKLEKFKKVFGDKMK